ncbi:MAG TPA: hypothetical protein VMT46_18785 [Anaerolineaceae bacterium]|nr:hypothetical protein [Anaerolineaceae bacterium]
MNNFPGPNWVEEEYHRRLRLANLLRGFVLALLILIAFYFLYSNHLPGLVHTVDLSTPSGSAEEFIRRLAAHQYEKAGEQLTSQLSQKVGADELHILFDHLEMQQHRILTVSADTVSIEGDNAVAAVQMISSKGDPQEVRLPLHKEGDIWRIASIAPLWSLVQQFSNPDLVIY